MIELAKLSITVEPEEGGAPGLYYGGGDDEAVCEARWGCRFCGAIADLKGEDQLVWCGPETPRWHPVEDLGCPKCRKWGLGYHRLARPSDAAAALTTCQEVPPCELEETLGFEAAEALVEALAVKDLAVVDAYDFSDAMATAAMLVRLEAMTLCAKMGPPELLKAISKIPLSGFPNPEDYDL